jgi:hypothetical protein
MRGWRDVPDDPEAWASILGWHCWRGVAGIWYGRRTGPSPTVVIRAGSLDALRALIDQWNAGFARPSREIRATIVRPGRLIGARCGRDGVS